MERGIEIKCIRTHAVAVRAPRPASAHREELKCAPDRWLAFLFQWPRQGIGVVCRA